MLDTDADATEAHIEAGFALDGALAAPLTVDGQGMVLASTDHGNVYSLLPESQSYGWTYPWSFGSPLIKNAVKSSWTATPPAGRGFTAGSPYTVTARLFPHFTADGQRVDFGFSLDNVPTPYAYLSVVRQSSGAVYFELTDLSNPATPQVVPGATLPFAVGRSWDDGVEVQFAYSGNWFDAVAGTYTIWFDAYARVADSHGVFTGGFTNVGSLGITAAALPGTLLPFTRSLDPNVTTLRLDGCTTYQWYAGGTAPGPYVNWQWNVAADGKRSRALPIRTAPTPWLGDVLAVGGDDGTVYGIGPRGEQWNAAPQPDTRTTQISSPWALFHREPRRQGSTDLAGLSEAGPYSPSLRWLQPHNNIIINSSPVVSDRGADRVTRVYAGTDDGLIQVSEDGGKSWRRVDKLPGVPDYFFVNKMRASGKVVSRRY